MMAGKMAENKHLHPSDWLGLSRLGVNATTGLTDLVEAMHHTIASGSGIVGAPVPGRPRGITGLVYRSIRGVTTLVGGTLDALLGQLVPLLGEKPSSPEREAVLAALNGVLGDYLEAQKNPLAIPMRFRLAGRALELQKAALSTAFKAPQGKILLVLHGLCMNDLQWAKGGDLAAAPATRLAEELGYTPLFLHYNSGRHVSQNGHDFAALLETLLQEWPVPVEELSILAHSMGGLLARSAYHQGAEAGQEWPRLVRHLVFLGTPHHGAPLERGGNWVDTVLGISPYSAPFARLGKIRSAGITDLRHGNLLEEDWHGRDRFERAADSRRHLPLPSGVTCHAIAVTTGKQAGDLGDRLLGDGLVPLRSALGEHQDPERCLHLPDSHKWVGYGMGHLELLGQPAVFEQAKRWLAD